MQQNQNKWHRLKKHRVVHLLLRISIVGFFSLLYVGMLLDTPDVTEAYQRDGSAVSMIRQIFGPHAPAALRVARCESGLNTQAYNPITISGSHATGVFQILYPSTWRGTSQAARSPYNPIANIVAAHDIFVHDGYSWRAWACRP